MLLHFLDNVSALSATHDEEQTHPALSYEETYEVIVGYCYKREEGFLHSGVKNEFCLGRSWSQSNAAVGSLKEVSDLIREEISALV